MSAKSTLILMTMLIGCAGEISGDPDIAVADIKKARSSADCTLVVPDDPLSAQGLATPYRLRTSSRRNGTCDEANASQAAFVQARSRFTTRW
jgi:hypothetical protein